MKIPSTTDLWSSYFGIMEYKTFKSAIKKATAPPAAFLQRLQRETLTDEELVERKRRGPRGCLVYDGWRANNAETWSDCVFFYYPSHAVAFNDWQFGNELYFALSEKWAEDPKKSLDGSGGKASSEVDGIAVTEVNRR